VTVLRGADLESQGIRTAAEALETVPGAHVARRQLRGQTSLFMRAARRLTPRFWLTACRSIRRRLIDLAHLTTDNVDRIEIVRGR